MKNVYDKIGKVRKPRVHITYDVETEGGSVKNEIPFIVGITGDFAGSAIKDQKPIKDRKFVALDADNFNEVMAKIAPTLDLKVGNSLANDNTEFAVNLKFNSMEDFSPTKIATQVPALNSLLEVRQKLSDLLSKADLSESLEKLLEEILQNQESLQSLSQQLGVENTAPTAEPLGT